ncbi:MAG TPA: DUF4097 family beta strand repeat-containing protein [Acidimicrobiales bacterium]|nr:DUF4097 family beta strand repeat-containing protein [Acidimicrobiales bacterium]
MPTFATPEPIAVTLEIGVGDVRIVAGERADTVVEVRPTDATKKSDVSLAEETRVDYVNGVLTIKAPKGRRQYRIWGGAESIDVEVEVPTGSHIGGVTGVASVRASGPLGDVRVKTGVGDIQLEQAGQVELKTGAGRIAIGRASGNASITTGSGTVEIGSLGGGGVVKNSNGDTWIGEATSDLRVRAANGKIVVERALGTVAAKSANGDIRLGEVSGGAISAETACGRIEIGVLAGVSAWLDLDTHFGDVRNGLDTTGPPQPGEKTVEVRARTAFGDVSVSRKVGSPTGIGAA